MAIELSQKVAYKAYPSSFCAGVNWGVDCLKSIAREHGEVFVINKDGVVHNNLVRDELELLGVRHVANPDDPPKGAVVANSMHGLSPLMVQTFMERGYLHYNLTCPMVEGVRRGLVGAIQTARKHGKIAKLLYTCKDTKHPEPKSLIELAPNNVVPVTGEDILENYQIQPGEMYFADSQTTINTVKALGMVERYGSKFPGLEVAPRIDGCFATFNRQLALEKLMEAKIRNLIVFGSSTSSNTTELVKIGHEAGIHVDFLERPSGLIYPMVRGYNTLGVHAGASAPPELAEEAMDILGGWEFERQDLRVADEPSTFSIKPRVYDYRNGSFTPEMLELTRVY